MDDLDLAVAEALAALRAEGAPALEFDGPPTHLSGGFWAQMWTLRTADCTRAHLPERLVLRFAPDAQMAAWETAFQAGVADQGCSTPRVRAFDFRPKDNRRPWCVMDFAQGAPMLSGLSGLGAVFALPRLVRALPDTIARAMADLHRLDPQPVQAALRQATERTIGVDGMLDRYITDSHDLGDARLQKLAERLAATKPAQGPLVLCHGDLHPFNVLTSDSGYVVLDWTTGQIANPAYDLAYTHLLMANPPLAAPKPLRFVLNMIARRTADRFVATYRTLSRHAVDSDTVEWFRTMHSCRILLDLAAWRADGSLDARRGHPWFLLEPTLLPLLG